MGDGMKFKDENLKEEFQKITVDDLVRVVNTLTVHQFKCPVCNNSNFSFIVNDQESRLLTPFLSHLMTDDDVDEHSVHYKMCCSVCGNEINFNAIMVLKRLKALNNE